MNTRKPIPAKAQERAEIVTLATQLLRLAESAKESILLGDYAQGAGNLEALSSVRIALTVHCVARVKEEHASLDPLPRA